MKKILVLCGLILVVGVVFAWKAMTAPDRFGTFTGAPQVEVTALVERPLEFLGKTVIVKGRVTEQCKAMGCFFFFHAGKDILRIDLEEIAMTAPMREGRTALVEGQLVRYRDGYQLFASGVEFE